MSEPLAAAHAAFSAPFSYAFPQASPCGAVLIYCRTDPHNVTLLTSTRAHFEKGDDGSEKRNHAAGGFYEVKDMFTEVSKVQDGDAEIYREMTEELGEGIADIIPYKDFVKRRKYLWDGMTRVRDTMNVHMEVQKTLEVTPAELDKILRLPPTKERSGFKLEDFDIDDSDYNNGHPDSYIRERLVDFLYPSEVDMAVKWFHELEDAAKISGGFTPLEW